MLPKQHKEHIMYMESILFFIFLMLGASDAPNMHKFILSKIAALLVLFSIAPLRCLKKKLFK